MNTDNLARTYQERRRAVTGYGVLKHVVMEYEYISLTAKSVYAYLSSFTSLTTNECWPSRHTITSELQISKDRLAKALTELKSRGVITVRQSHTADRHYSTNHYFINRSAKIRLHDNGYGFISAAAMRDPSISVECKGLYAYLTSKADASTNKASHISLQTMAQELDANRESISKYIKVLVNAGYVTEIIPTGRGFKTHEYLINFMPQQIEQVKVKKKAGAVREESSESQPIVLPSDTSNNVPTMTDIKDYYNDPEFMKITRSKYVNLTAFFNYYEHLEWHDQNGLPVTNWKIKLLHWALTSRRNRKAAGVTKKSVASKATAYRRNHFNEEESKSAAYIEALKDPSKRISYMGSVDFYRDGFDELDDLASVFGKTEKNLSSENPDKKNSHRPMLDDNDAYDDI